MNSVRTLTSPRATFADAVQSRDLDWQIDGRDWPHHRHSHFVRAGGIEWHVQMLGDGPALLLLHGTGASTHSWAALADCLASRYTLIIPDLPGHGFSSAAGTPSLPGMALALTALLATLGMPLAGIVGHSAGAAIMLRMHLDGIATAGSARAVPLISLNGALLPFAGIAGSVFAPAARLLARGSAASRFFAWRATRPAVVTRLLDSTGSTLDARAAERYRRLATAPAHVAAALAMMANWDLAALTRDLAQVHAPLTLVVGARDRMVPPAQAYTVARAVRGARVQVLPRLGHLAHEEAPAGVATLVHQAIEEDSARG